MTLDLAATVQQSEHCCPSYGIGAHLTRYTCGKNEKMTQEEIREHTGFRFSSESLFKGRDDVSGVDVTYDPNAECRYVQKYRGRKATVSSTMPENADRGEITYIFFCFTHGITAYEYTWVE